MTRIISRFSKQIWTLISLIGLTGSALLILNSINASQLKEICESHFKRAIDLTKEAVVAENKLFVASSVVSEVVAGGETFLNYCMNRDLPLSSQQTHLSELAQLANVIPTEFKCSGSYSPVVQLIDSDVDSTNDLILHTRALRCDGYGLGFGGLSIFFSEDHQAKQWHGTVIWPCFDQGCDWADSWIQSTQPSVQKINVHAVQSDTFLLVAGGYVGADANNEFLIVWRWDGTHADRSLLLHLSDWCGWPIKWDVTDDGRIVIPATNATPRCTARSSQIYALQGNAFTLSETNQ